MLKRPWLLVLWLCKAEPILRNMMISMTEKLYPIRHNTGNDRPSFNCPWHAPKHFFTFYVSRWVNKKTEARSMAV